MAGCAAVACRKSPYQYIVYLYDAVVVEIAGIDGVADACTDGAETFPVGGEVVAVADVFIGIKDRTELTTKAYET